MNLISNTQNVRNPSQALSPNFPPTKPRSSRRKEAQTLFPEFTQLLLTVLLAATTLPASAADDLSWPPITAQTRPWAWWWWHGSAVDETNITHELQRFHDAGLGGVQITTIYGVKAAEARDIPYLSPRWLKMMGYTVDEAHRLGMGVDMSLGSGWCFGGPTVSDRDANASVVVKTCEVSAGNKIQGKFSRDATQALMAFSADGKNVDLTEKITATGDVDWIAPAGSWTIYAISQKPSGQKVKRAAPGGEGWMLNPAYPQSVRDWLPWFDKAFANYTGSKPEAVFQDSYEHRTDWSPDFFAQFEKLRGYKLQTELPALFGDTRDEHTARVKYDYRRTLSEIMSEQSEPAWIDWAHKNGFSTIYQAHGTPANWLDLYGDADMPETEMFHNDRSILISKFASSAAHTQGRQLTGAETGTWLKEHFTETLADLKYLADDMFLAGVNHIYYHGASYSPDDAPWPGWLFYASTEMNPRNPIWHDVGALNEYIARCQSILQEGKPDNDVLLYWPVADYWSDPNGLVQPMSVSKTEWFENQPIGRTARELWNEGYSFDYVSDAQLHQAKVTDGKIQMPGGNYGVIFVPQCKYFPLETFEQMLSLAKKGATVIFDRQLPTDVPGENDLDKSRATLKQLEDGLSFQTTSNRVGNFVHIADVGKGKIEYGNPNYIGFLELMVGHGLEYIRRSYEGGWTYFIANRTANNFDGDIVLTRSLNSVAILDPMSGKTGRFNTGRYEDRKIVHLQLASGQSIILRVSAEKNIAEQPWIYWQPKGQPVEITGTWNVKFLTSGPTLPADFQTAKLASWTTFPDTNAQTFAGTAKYEITFDAPERRSPTRHDTIDMANTPDRRPALQTESSFELNLGDVRQSARVRVNGKDYGTLITPPFRVMVDNLKPTGNVLEVEVTSVAANRIRDLDRRHVNWKYFKDINIVDENYRPFDASNWPLTDCGLLGPVTLTPATAE